MIADGQPKHTKALLRLLIAELRVNSKADIQPTYRVLTPDRLPTAGACPTSEKSGEDRTLGKPLFEAPALDLSDRPRDAT